MLAFVQLPPLFKTAFHCAARWDAVPDPATLPGILPDVLRAASPKRQSEFLIGRLCAANALRLLNAHGGTDVGMNPDGSPRWPAGVVGSITHTQGFAAAAVASSARCRGIGVDAERRPSPDILNTDAELLAFSAKESVYKCLFPLAQDALDPEGIRLTGIRHDAGYFTFDVSDALRARLGIAGGEGRFAWRDQRVHTAVELSQESHPG